MRRKPRIVHLIETLGYGGAERLLSANLAHLDRNRYDHIVVYLFEPDPLRGEIESLGVPCVGLRLENRRKWLLALRTLRAQLGTLEPDLIHTHLVRTDIYGRIVGCSLGIPVVCTIHESPYYPEVYVDNPTLSRTKYSIMRLADRWTARTVERFVVVSQFSATAARTYLGIPQERMRLIYNALDPDRIAPAPAAQEQALREQLGIAVDDRVILHVGRMAPQKGHRYLLQAFARVLRAQPAARLVLRGDGPLSGPLRELAATLGIAPRVTFAPPVEQTSWLLGLSEVFAFPSMHEGFGIALLEAMAMSKPAVASAIAPITELLEHGREGLLVPPRDPDGLADALLALLRDTGRAREMGERARQTVLEKFDIRKNALTLQSLYAELLERAAPSHAVAGEVTPSPEKS